MGKVISLSIAIGESPSKSKSFTSDAEGIWNLTSIDEFMHFLPSDTHRLFDSLHGLTTKGFDLVVSDDQVFGSVGALIFLIGERRKVVEYIGLAHLGQKLDDFN